MARTAIATAPDSVRWNRCKDECGCNGTPDPRFCRCWSTSKGKCGRDRRTNAQMRHYALSVTYALTGDAPAGFFRCPLTGRLTAVTDGQVDKTDPARGYTPGTVVMVSIIGNQERANLQKAHRDVYGVARYIADVAAASLSVSILPVSVAWARVSEVQGRQLGKGESTGADTNSRNIIEGPYGI